jgi:hypothetical protein
MPTISLLRFFVSSNLLPFSAHFILGNKKKSGGNKSGEYGVRNFCIDTAV